MGGSSLSPSTEIALTGANWKTKDDFYASLLSALGAPDWHGHNLDALWDSITGGDINQVNLPLSIRITGIDSMSQECKELVQRFVSMISDAQAEGFSIHLTCS